MRRLAVIMVVVGLTFPAWAADPKNPIEIEEWDVPYAGGPRDPDVTSAGEVWFVGQRGHYIGRFDAETGAFDRRELDDGAGPHNLIVGSDGAVWYSGNLRGYIGRYDPVSGALVKIAMPDARARDPHTLVFGAGERHIWFTVQGGNLVGRLTLADQSVDLIPVPTSGARPYGIIIEPAGVPWVALFGTNKLASVDPVTLELTEHELPDGARPRRVGATSDGRIFYVDYRRGYLGRLDPATEDITEWPMPSGQGAKPYGMAIDAQDRIWFVETGISPNNFVGFAPDGEIFFSITPIPSGAGSVRHMDYHEPTQTIWFGTDNNTLGRAYVK